MLLFGILSAISSAVLIISNLAAGKIWSLFGWPADGGLIIFPLTYIIGDLIVSLYGEKKANVVVVTSMSLAGLMALVMSITTNFLPPYPGWDDQAAFATVFSSASRITIASLTGYLLSNLLNNHVFEKIHTGFIGKALGSSAVSRVVDNLVFETIAFLGILPLKDFFLQVLFGYLAGMLLETLLSPVSNRLYRWLKKFPLTTSA